MNELSMWVLKLSRTVVAFGMGTKTIRGSTFQYCGGLTELAEEGRKQGRVVKVQHTCQASRVNHG